MPVNPIRGSGSSGGQSDFGLGESVRRATAPRPNQAFGAGPARRPPMPDQAQQGQSQGPRPGDFAGGWVPPGLARQGVTSFTPGQGNPFGDARRSSGIPLPEGAAPPVPTQAALPNQTQGPLAEAIGLQRRTPWGSSPMFSWLFGGQ
jgi:hypothetical protein